jgi:hypothetical protein
MENLNTTSRQGKQEQKKSSSLTLLRSYALTVFFLLSMTVTAQDVISFKWNVESGSLSKSVTIQATSGEAFTVDWGDLSTTPYAGNGTTDVTLSHSYASTGEYDVTIEADFPTCKFTSFNCSNSNVTTLDVSGATALTHLECENNHLLLSDLFAASQQLISPPADKYLGTQTLSITSTSGDVLFGWPPQNEFGGTYTTFTVMQGGSPATDGVEYSVTDGNIAFIYAGTYEVTMTNSKIVATSGHDAEVKFEITVYPLTITSSSGSNGTISPSGTLYFNYGDNQTYTFTPNAGYIISQVVIDGYDNSGAAASGSFTFLNIGEDHVIEVYFATAPAPPPPPTPNYGIFIGSFTGGKVSVDIGSAQAGQTVKLTISTDKDYKLKDIQAYRNDNGTSVALSGTGNTRTFTMPASDVTVKASFEKTGWAKAKELIENAVFNVPQEATKDSNTLLYALVDIINTLIAETGCAVTVDDIVIFGDFLPAQAGDAANTAGKNGHFNFRVSPPQFNNSAYSECTIAAKPYDTTGTEAIPQSGSLKAWAQSGTLHVTGLTPGAEWKVYMITGVLIYQSTATGSDAQTDLPAHGLYIVTDGITTVKVVY